QGIWKPVYLRTWNDARIRNIHIVQDSMDNETAWLTSNFELESSKEQDCFLTVIDEDKQEILNKIRVRLTKGTQLYPIVFNIKNPKLWWTTGLGDPFLYRFKFMIQTNGSIDALPGKIGIRTIELVQQSDSIGESFYFKLNGVPVFMKGANYIPQDNFPSRVSEKKYRQTIQAAVDANMNMLRVWGGGIYENDIFYDLCDENGILVWQDFMFACNMYPGDSVFIENVKQEAVEQVKRLRNHPCLALWCGNNEIDEAWFNWGWQKSLGYSEEDSTEIWNNYLKIFEKLLPEVISEYSLYFSYIPSSPKIGWGHEEAMREGDMHYWGVWWGEEPFEIYEEKVGRFMSEYGFQGFPDLKTIESFTKPKDRNLQSPALLNHQKHPRGMELIQTYMEREYNIPDNFEDYIYVCQLVQAYGIKTAIEAHRRAKPYCMGTLYWQLNDCWPVISWSSVDYYNRWKALHYFVKKAFGEFLISFEEKNDSLKIFVVSDKLQSINAVLDLRIVSFAGDEHWSDKQVVEVAANSSSIYYVKQLTGFSKKDHLFSAKLISNEKVLASNIYYFLPVKDLQLPEPNIQKEIVKTEKGYQIILKTDKLAKNVFLSIDEDGFFSDNYFDLLPGDNKRVSYISEQSTDSFESDLKTISIFDTY
ncbi:MAG: glycoside hydrolase family 2 protein, partial [Bacteroidales bacterium]|nr:glycoside hydrolase family 2 protein [Bacteroidales bacterium]